jgi:hypothetical protein
MDFGQDHYADIALQWALTVQGRCLLLHLGIHAGNTPHPNAPSLSTGYIALPCLPGSRDQDSKLKMGLVKALSALIASTLEHGCTVGFDVEDCHAVGSVRHFKIRVKLVR